MRLPQFAERFVQARIVVSLLHPVNLSTPDAFAWVESTMSARAGRWKNRITFESIEHSLYNEPIPSQEAIFSIPLCLIVGEKGFLAAPDFAVAVHGQAMEPKSFTVLKGGHFDGFPGEGFEISSTTAVKWFEKYLRQIETPVLQLAVA